MKVKNKTNKKQRFYGNVKLNYKYLDLYSKHYIGGGGGEGATNYNRIVDSSFSTYCIAFRDTNLIGNINRVLSTTRKNAPPPPPHLHPQPLMRSVDSNLTPVRGGPAHCSQALLLLKVLKTEVNSLPTSFMLVNTTRYWNTQP